MPWSSKYFTLVELACVCGCDIRPEMEFLERLEAAREIYGHPMIVTSGMRCHEYQRYLNRDVPVSGHTGWGIDVRCESSGERYHMYSAIRAAGFNRIGIYDKHIHFDCHPNLPPDKLWMGRSK